MPPLQWSIAQGGDIPTLVVHSVRAWAVRRDDAHLLVADTRDTSVRYVDLCAAREGSRVEGGPPVTALAWHEDNAWIVRSGPEAHATLEIRAGGALRLRTRRELAGLRARSHRVTFDDAGAVAFVARSRLCEEDRRDPGATLGWLVETRSGTPLRAVSLRDLDPDAVVTAHARNVATALSPDGRTLAVAVARREARGGPDNGVWRFDLAGSTSVRCTASLHLPALDVRWAAERSLVVRSARDDSGGHRSQLGRVLLLDERGAVVHDTAQRPRDPTLTSEWDLGTTHAELGPSGDRMIILGHGMYVPIRRMDGSQFGSQSHARAYVVTIPGGRVERTLELDTNPWNGVGAVWPAEDALSVLTCAGSRWALTPWGAEGAGAAVYLGHCRDVVMRARLWRTPAGRYQVVSGRSWPEDGGHLRFVRLDH